jgi:hypothetical protein
MTSKPSNSGCPIKRPVLSRAVVGKAERLRFSPGLSEAIRQLVELGLKAKGKR